MNRYGMQDVFARMTMLCARLKIPFGTERPHDPGEYWLDYNQTYGGVAMYHEVANNTANLIPGPRRTRRQVVEACDFALQMLHEADCVRWRNPPRPPLNLTPHEITTALEAALGRTATAEENEDFVHYCNRNIYPWLRREAKYMLMENEKREEGG